VVAGACGHNDKELGTWDARNGLDPDILYVVISVIFDFGILMLLFNYVKLVYDISLFDLRK
jgi:hypothetical protein